MRPVPNELLAAWTKRLRVSGEDFVETVLGPCAAIEVSPLRSFGKFLYYQYCDGRAEGVVVSSLPESMVYRPLIRPRIAVVDVTDSAIDVSVQVAEHCSLQAVGLVFGQPQTSVGGRDKGEGVFTFGLEDLPRPVLGSLLMVAVKVGVGEAAFTVQVPLPYCELAHILGRSGLSSLSVEGANRIFVDDVTEAGVDRVLRAVDQGLVELPTVEPLTRVESKAGLQVLAASRYPCATVDWNGVRYLLVARSAAQLAALDEWSAYRAAAQVSWAPASEVPRSAAMSGAGRIATMRRSGAVRLLRARRRAIVGALDVLGYERYHRAITSMSLLKPRNAYWEYVQRGHKALVRPRTVLHVGFNNVEFSGHLARLALSFAELQPDWTQIVVADDPEAARRTCQRLGIRAEVVAPQSRRYGDALLTSEVILTDATLPRWFTPTPSQRLYNVWHGTPLKAMGRAIGGDPRALSNTQRNFLQSTAVLLSNAHTIDSFVRDYMVPPDNFELMPSARNSWLFDEAAGPRIRRELGIPDGELVVLYLPTWRGEGNSMRDIEVNIELFRVLSRIRSRIRRPVRFYAKPHRFTRGLIDPAEMGFHLPPEDLDLYEFLTVVDCLVTDYSSVLFDFLPVNRPILLDLHDLEEYTGSRGLCIPPSELGLTMARDEDALVSAIESAPAVEDHSELTARYAPLDSADGAAQVLQRLLRPTPRPVPRAGRERVLMYPGSLWTNGITTSFLNLLANLDQDAREYWVFLPQSFTSRPGPGILDAIVESGVRYLPSPAGFVVRLQEKLLYQKFNSRLTLTHDEMRSLDDMMLREADRTMPGLHFDHVVNFSGYEAYIAKFLGALTLRGARMHTWVHNDMAREQELRRNFNEPILMEAYRRSATINVVSHPVAERLLDGYFPADVTPRVRVVHNTVDSGRVRALSQAPVDYLTPQLEGLLEDSSITKFVTIGRFSPEKDHIRLVEAFDEVSRSNPHRRTALFLIGGPGNSRELLLARIAASEYADRIHVFEGINPHPILRRCDLFVLSSHYEGLPMVFFEALALDVPILSTAIPGPKEFLEAGYGSTCEPTTDGLVVGMQAFLDDSLPSPTKSLTDFNRQAIDEFEALFTQR